MKYFKLYEPRKLVICFNWNEFEVFQFAPIL